MPPRYSETQAREAVAAAYSWAEALRLLQMQPTGGNWKTLKRYALEVWHIPNHHFDPDAGTRRATSRRGKPLGEVLVAGSTYSRGHLKKRLYAEGLKERRCELCGQDEIWRGARMALILDHINGVSDDHRLENLRIVCPNCAATLETHCGRNLPSREVQIECERCGRRFRRVRREQRYCSRACGTRHERARGPRPAAWKVEHPPYEQIAREVAATSYLAVGRKYGVSDNAIRKWLLAYERELGVQK